MWGWVLGGIVGTAIATRLIENKIESRAFDIEAPLQTNLGNTKVSINCCSLNEAWHIEKTLRSIHENLLFRAYPDNFEIILIDSGSTDRTIELARPYVNKIINAPRGKLTSRNLGVQNSSGEIVVSIDSDCVYPPRFLDLLLRHFHDPKVVVSTGPDLLYDGTPIWNFYAIWANILTRPDHWVHGNNMAFYKWAWEKAGGWDESVNQFDFKSIWKEEEINFGERLEQFGERIYDLEAVSYATMRRQKIDKTCSVCQSGSPAECNFCMQVAQGQRF